MLVGLAVMIATQLYDLCHEVPLFDRALVENHMTNSNMYHLVIHAYMMFS